MGKKLKEVGKGGKARGSASPKPFGRSPASHADTDSGIVRSREEGDNDEVISAGKKARVEDEEEEQLEDMEDDEDGTGDAEPTAQEQQEMVAMMMDGSAAAAAMDYHLEDTGVTLTATTSVTQAVLTPKATVTKPMSSGQARNLALQLNARAEAPKASTVPPMRPLTEKDDEPPTASDADRLALETMAERNPHDNLTAAVAAEAAEAAATAATQALEAAATAAKQALEDPNDGKPPAPETTSTALQGETLRMRTDTAKYEETQRDAQEALAHRKTVKTTGNEIAAMMQADIPQTSTLRGGRLYAVFELNRESSDRARPMTDESDLASELTGDFLEKLTALDLKIIDVKLYDLHQQATPGGYSPVKVRVEYETVTARDNSFGLLENPPNPFGNATLNDGKTVKTTTKFWANVTKEDETWQILNFTSHADLSRAGIVEVMKEALGLSPCKILTKKDPNDTTTTPRALSLKAVIEMKPSSAGLRHDDVVYKALIETRPDDPQLLNLDSHFEFEKKRKNGKPVMLYVRPEGLTCTNCEKRATEEGLDLRTVHTISSHHPHRETECVEAWSRHARMTGQPGSAPEGPGGGNGGRRDSGGRGFSGSGQGNRDRGLGGPGPCYAFQQGKCYRGAACRFTHAAGEAPASGSGAAKDTSDRDVDRGDSAHGSGGQAAGGATSMN